MRLTGSIKWVAVSVFLFIIPAKQIAVKDYYYWAVKYNNVTLFNSNKDSNKKWAYGLSINSINQKDSITLLLEPDTPVALNPAIIIKDSTAKKMIRYFPGTDKIAVKDILRYVTKENNKVWLLYTHKEPGKDGIVVWDLNDTYPRRSGCSPRLYLTFTE